MNAMHKIGLFSAIAVFCTWLGSPNANAGQVYLNGLATGAETATVNVQSFQSQKFNKTIKQEYDFSCGSAALATLLTFTYHRPVTESDVFASMYVNGNQPVIRKYGFSLLDMKDYLSRQGLPAGGFRAPLSKFIQVRVPGIVLINEHGYRHFVVLRGVENGRVLLADPAIGLRTESVADFQKQWAGVFFIILADIQVAQANFNGVQDWGSEPGAPVDLGRFAVNLATLQQVSIPNPASF